MAGFNVAGLPAFIQYQGELQQQAQRQQAAEFARQQQQQQLVAFQQQQADRQRAQAAQTAAGNALPQLLAGGQVAAQPQQGQMPPPPQPPAPGQASQPAQQGAPLPGQGPAPGGVQSPLPQGGVQGQQGQLPPFRPMPTTPPQSAAPQGAIPAPPAQAAATSPADRIPGGGLTFQNAVKVLQDQGLSGADLMAGLQQLTPVLDAQSKQQAAQLQAQFNQEVKLQTLQNQKDAIQQRAEAAQQASEDRRLGIQERAQAAAESRALQGELLRFRMDEAKQKHAGDPDAKLDKDTVDLLAQQALAGDTSVYQNLGRGVQGAQNIVAIRKRVAELAKGEGKTGADVAAGNVAFQGEKAAARSTAVAAGKQSQAADEANTLADQALDVAGKIDATQFPTVNAWVNRLTQQGATSKEARDQLAAFKVANQGFRNTYARAITPTGAPTVHDKQHADELFDINQAPDAYAASLAQAKKEMAAAIAAPGHVQAQQRARISGKPAEGAGGPVKINSDADYANLPSGAEFIAPDGSHRRKP